MTGTAIFWAGRDGMRTSWGEGAMNSEQKCGVASEARRVRYPIGVRRSLEFVVTTAPTLTRLPSCASWCMRMASSS